MSTILFTAGAKGGTGKSTAIRFIITFLRQNGIEPLLLDLDDENRTLSRFFPEALKIAIRKKSSHDVLVERALEPESLLIADLKAGTGREVLDWWLDIPFEELQSQQVRFICVAAITSSPDSVQSFFNWVSVLRRRVAYVVFKNLKDGDCLPDYDTSNQAILFREKYSPHHIVLPRLDEEYITELERLNLTVGEVLDGSDGKSARGREIGPLLSQLMVRARLRRFQHDIYAQLDPILKAVLRESDDLYTGLLKDIEEFCNENKKHKTLSQYVETLPIAGKALADASRFITEAGRKDFPLLALYATPYLELFGDAIVGWLLLWQGIIAQGALNKIISEKSIDATKGLDTFFSENADAAFYTGKIASVKYFISNVVSQASSKGNVIMNCDRAALEIAESCF